MPHTKMRWVPTNFVPLMHIDYLTACGPYSPFQEMQLDCLLRGARCEKCVIQRRNLSAPKGCAQSFVHCLLSIYYIQWWRHWDKRSKNITLCTSEVLVIAVVHLCVGGCIPRYSLTAQPTIKVSMCCGRILVKPLKVACQLPFSFLVFPERVFMWLSWN